jgi:hypothetical protein
MMTLLIGCGGGGSGGTGDGGQAYSAPETLVGGTFTVPAGHFYSIPFNGGLSSNISGNFGANGNIEVFIFDEIQYSNWENGQWEGDFYASGRVSSGSIKVNGLEEGAHTYYLVYSNLFSLFTDKEVTSNVQLTQH